jgi:hypothetical protein
LKAGKRGGGPLIQELSNILYLCKKGGGPLRHCAWARAFMMIIR